MKPVNELLEKYHKVKFISHLDSGQHLVRCPSYALGHQRILSLIATKGYEGWNRNGCYSSAKIQTHGAAHRLNQCPRVETQSR